MASSSPEFRLPPGPKAPGLIQGALFVSGSKRVREFAHRRFGDVFTISIPTFGKSVVVADPELVKQVFRADPKVLHAGETPLGVVFGGHSLFSLDEDEHLMQRKLLLPPFHGERIQSYEGIIEEETRREIASWPEGEEFETLPSMMRITLNVILRAVFGAEDEELEGLRRLMPAWVKLGSRMVSMPFLFPDLGPGSPGRRHARYRREYDAYVDALIAKARRDPNLERRADVLALLLQATHEDGSPMSRDEIADHLASLLAAGHETTAGTLAWAVERVRRHPPILRRLVEEVQAGGKELREATIREVQRTRPVIGGTFRIVKRPFELGEWLLPPGSTIIVASVLIHDDSRHFEHADRFDPDRFIGNRPDPNRWTPFGGGVRRCVGAAFAQMEMDVVLRTLLARMEFDPTSEAAEGWKFRGVSFVPAKGGRAVARRRTAPPPSRPPIETGGREAGREGPVPAAAYRCTSRTLSTPHLRPPRIRSR
jgi:cytochrome P450